MVQWTGYSDQRLLDLAKAGVIKRRGRGRYLLRASVTNLLRSMREWRPELSHPLLQELATRGLE